MKKLVLFGDSITAGYRRDERSPILTDLVSENVVGFEVANAGVPGDTTEDGLRRIDEAVLQQYPDLVLLFFGANDVADHYFVPLEKYRHNLQAMIKKIGKEKCILCTPPYIDQKVHQKDRPLQRVKDYADVVQEVAAGQGCLFINLLGSMLQYPAIDNLLQADGLHFSEEGYQFLSQRIVSQIKVHPTYQNMPD